MKVESQNLASNWFIMRQGKEEWKSMHYYENKNAVKNRRGKRVWGMKIRFGQVKFYLDDGRNLRRLQQIIGI